MRIGRFSPVYSFSLILSLILREAHRAILCLNHTGPGIVAL